MAATDIPGTDDDTAPVPAEVVQALAETIGSPVRIVHRPDENHVMYGNASKGRMVVIGPSGPSGWRVDIWRIDESRSGPLTLASVRDDTCGPEYLQAMVNLALEQSEATGFPEIPAPLDTEAALRARSTM